MLSKFTTLCMEQQKIRLSELFLMKLVEVNQKNLALY